MSFVYLKCLKEVCDVHKVLGKDRYTCLNRNNSTNFLCIHFRLNLNFIAQNDLDFFKKDSLFSLVDPGGTEGAMSPSGPVK